MKKWSTLWKTYRWKLFFTIATLYTLIYGTQAGLFLYSYQAYTAFYTHTVLYSLFLNFLVIISVAQVLQYFRESPRMSVLVYVYAFSICAISIVDLGDCTPFMAFAMALSSGLLQVLYSIICLLRVKAPEISFRFKAIACYNILSAVLTISYSLFGDTYPLFQTVTFSLFRSAVALSCYILILLTLYKVMQMPESYQRETGSIGEMP